MAERKAKQEECSSNFESDDESSSGCTDDESCQNFNTAISLVNQYDEVYIPDTAALTRWDWEQLRLRTQHYEELFCHGDCVLELSEISHYIKKLAHVHCVALPVSIVRDRSLLLKLLPPNVHYLVLTCQPENPPFDALRELCSDPDLRQDLPTFILCQDYIRRLIPGLAIPHEGTFHTVNEMFALFHCALPTSIMECNGGSMEEINLPDYSQGVQAISRRGLLLRYGVKAFPASFPVQKTQVSLNPMWHKFFHSDLENSVPWRSIKFLNDTWSWVTEQAPEPEIRYPVRDLPYLHDVYRKGRLVGRVGSYGIVRTESIRCEQLKSLEQLLAPPIEVAGCVDGMAQHRQSPDHRRCGIPAQYEVLHLSEMQPSLRSIHHPDLQGVRNNPLLSDETILFPASPLFPGLMLVGLIRYVDTQCNKLFVVRPEIEGEIEVAPEGCERFVCLARNHKQVPPFYLGCPKLCGDETLSRKTAHLVPRSRASRQDFAWLGGSRRNDAPPDIIPLSQYQQMCVSFLGSLTHPRAQTRVLDPVPPLSFEPRPLRKSSRLCAQRAQANIAMLASQETEEAAETETAPGLSRSACLSESVIKTKSQIFRAKEEGRPSPPYAEKPDLATRSVVVGSAASEASDSKAMHRASKRPVPPHLHSLEPPQQWTAVEPEDVRPLNKRRKRDGVSDADNPVSVSALTTVASQSHPAPETRSNGSSTQQTSDEDLPLKDLVSVSASRARLFKVGIEDARARDALRGRLISALAFLASLGLDVVGSSVSGLYHTFAEPSRARDAASSPSRDGPLEPRVSADLLRHTLLPPDISLSESPSGLGVASRLAASNFNSSPAVVKDHADDNYLRHYAALYSRYPLQAELFCRGNRQGRRHATFDPIVTRGQTSGMRTRRQVRDRGGGNSPISQNLDSQLGPPGSLESLNALLQDGRDAGAVSKETASLGLSGSAINAILLGVDKSLPAVVSTSETAELSRLLRSGPRDSVALPKSCLAPSLHGFCPCAQLQPITVLGSSLLVNANAGRFATQLTRNSCGKRISNETTSSSGLRVSSGLRRRTPRLSPRHCRPHRKDGSLAANQQQPVELPSAAGGDSRPAAEPRSFPVIRDTRHERPPLSTQEIAQLRQRLKTLFERLGSMECKVTEITHAVASACAPLAITRKLSIAEFMAIVSVPKLIADRSDASVYADSATGDENHSPPSLLDEPPPNSWARTVTDSNPMYRFQGDARFLNSSRVPQNARSALQQKVYFPQQPRSHPVWSPPNTPLDFEDLRRSLPPSQSRLNQETPRIVIPHSAVSTVGVSSRPHLVNRDLPAAAAAVYQTDMPALELRQKFIWNEMQRQFAKGGGLPPATSTYQALRVAASGVGGSTSDFPKIPFQQCRPPPQPAFNPSTSPPVSRFSESTPNEAR